MLSTYQLAEAKHRGDVPVRTRPPWPGDLVGLARAGAWRRGDPKLERVCRLCGRGNLPTFRHSWHPRCAAVIQAAIFPYSAVCWTLRRQRGVCATCPEVLGVPKGGRWDLVPRVGRRNAIAEVDHVVPLWRVALLPFERQTLRWWLPGNLQALCVPCHRVKTKLEAAQRAELRSPQRPLFPIAEALA